MKFLIYVGILLGILWVIWEWLCWVFKPECALYD